MSLLRIYTTALASSSGDFNKIPNFFLVLSYSNIPSNIPILLKSPLQAFLSRAKESKVLFNSSSEADSSKKEHITALFSLESNWSKSNLKAPILDSGVVLKEYLK